MMDRGLKQKGKVKGWKGGIVGQKEGAEGDRSKEE